MERFKIKTNHETYSKVEELLLDGGFSIQVPTGKDWVIGEFEGVISSYSNWNNNPPKWFYDIQEITLPELRAMVNPMKEYLVKTKEGEYHYINDSYDTCPAYVEKIEIPEGSQFAVLNGEDEIAFYDGDGLEKSHFIPGAIIWQRHTQPEPLPFIDDQPKSLNDQYAEIEQVRQQTIEETLAERQGQYGCYEDVAYITQEILKALRISGYDRMPATHKESMHMIASKMARLVCGDCNHSDSWHDIAGYAKLVEDTI